MKLKNPTRILRPGDLLPGQAISAALPGRWLEMGGERWWVERFLPEDLARRIRRARLCGSCGGVGEEEFCLLCGARPEEEALLLEFPGVCLTRRPGAGFRRPLRAARRTSVRLLGQGDGFRRRRARLRWADGTEGQLILAPVQIRYRAGLEWRGRFMGLPVDLRAGEVVRRRAGGGPFRDIIGVQVWAGEPGWALVFRSLPEASREARRRMGAKARRLRQALGLELEVVGGANRPSAFLLYGAGPRGQTLRAIARDPDMLARAAGVELGDFQWLDPDPAGAPWDRMIARAPSAAARALLEQLRRRGLRPPLAVAPEIPLGAGTIRADLVYPHGIVVFCGEGPGTAVCRDLIARGLFPVVLRGPEDHVRFPWVFGELLPEGPE